MAAGKFFQEVELPQQKAQEHGALFPAVLYPNHSADSTPVELCDFKEAIRAHKPWLDSFLQKSGAILFRGFPVASPSDFNDVVQAFGYPEDFYVGARVFRVKVVDRVYTSNEAPPEKGIPFHHEMAYFRDFPTKLFFFCDEEPGDGGETPIVLSHIIYKKMKERHPELVAQLEEHGLTYTKVSNEEDNPSSFTGNGWKSRYNTDDKNIAEERCFFSKFVTSPTFSKHGLRESSIDRATKLEWIGNCAKTTTCPLPAVRLDKESGRKTWFNGLAISYSGPASKKFCSGDTSVELGNGKHVPDHVVEDYLKILEEECVAIPWKKGDVLLVNNLMVLHGRRPILKPPRRILASLCK